MISTRGARVARTMVGIFLLSVLGAVPVASCMPTTPVGGAGDAGPGLCGNGIYEPAYDEQCDGADLGGKTCNSVFNGPTAGFGFGTLQCAPDCTLDISQCHFCAFGNTGGSFQCN